MDITLLMLPFAFWYVGTVTAVISMAIICILAALTSRLLIDTARLQSNNFNFKSAFEFEQLIAPFLDNINIKGTLASDFYILMQQLEQTIVIIFSSLIFDKLLVKTFEKEIPLKNNKSQFYYLVGLLPIVDADQRPIVGSELIKISYGFAIICVLTIVTGQSLSELIKCRNVGLKVLSVLRVLSFCLLVTAVMFIANPVKLVTF